MKITLEQAYYLLDQASAVIMDDHVVTFANTSELTGEADNEFLYVGWEDDGLDFSVTAREGENQSVEANGPRLTFTNSDGELFDVTLLDTMHIANKLIERKYRP